VINKRLVPWLIGVLCLAQLVVAGTAAADLRADQRKAAALAREKRAVAAFHTALMPIAFGVFDSVQPLHDAVDDEKVVSQPYFPQLRNDAFDRTGAPTAVLALQGKLAKLDAPASRAKSMKALTQAMKDLLAATKQLAAATHAKGDRDGYVRAFGPALSALESSSSHWRSALVDEFGPGKVPSPSTSRFSDAGRKSPSKGTFVVAMDRACGTASVAMDAIPENVDFMTVGLPKDIAINEGLYRAMKTIAVPAGDATARRIATSLGAAAGYVQRERAIAAAGKRGDQVALQAAYRAWLRSLPAVRDLSHAFGSTAPPSAGTTGTSATSWRRAVRDRRPT
jgi:hypothetical protein